MSLDPRDGDAQRDLKPAAPDHPRTPCAVDLPIRASRQYARVAPRGSPPMKPFSQACENNKGPILAVLREVLGGARHVLEIGSGTGQHAAHFAAHLPQVVWHTSDLAEHHAGIRAWIDEAGLANVRAPVALDVNEAHWAPEDLDHRFDAVFSANTAHIMDWPSVERMVAGVGRVLAPCGVLALYGPFRRHGAHTSESNARFDRMLRARDPESGVRDLEAIDALARDAGLALEAEHALPANNRLVIWRRPAA